LQEKSMYAIKIISRSNEDRLETNCNVDTENTLQLEETIMKAQLRSMNENTGSSDGLHMTHKYQSTNLSETTIKPIRSFHFSFYGFLLCIYWVLIQAFPMRQLHTQQPCFLIAIYLNIYSQENQT